MISARTSPRRAGLLEVASAKVGFDLPSLNELVALKHRRPTLPARAHSPRDICSGVICPWVIPCLDPKGSSDVGGSGKYAGNAFKGTAASFFDTPGHYGAFRSS
jgi:hypothetical protein